MAFWWVNHKQTYKHEVRGGYLWSPLRNANGARNQSYDNMALVQVGDIVLSFANAMISAVGRVTVSATLSPKPPEFGAVGGYWADEGWLLEVDFAEVPVPLKPQQHMSAIGPLLPERYSPIRKNGHGNQGCYLAAIPNALGLLLLELTEAAAALPLLPRLRDPGAEANPDLLIDLDVIAHDTAVSETQRVQLARARVGQGLFRKRVILLNERCLLTGVEESRLLIASHIKPWNAASNAERLDGNNGLLLSPHVDALFDSHLLTFQDNGRLDIHPALPLDVLDRWSIDPGRKVQPFRPAQIAYLQHHREAFARKVL